MQKNKKNDNILNINIDDIISYLTVNLKQIIYFFIILLVVIFFIIFVKNNKKNKQEKLMTEYYQALYLLDLNKIDDALSILDKLYLSKINSNIKTIIGIRYAKILLSQNKNEETLKIYKDIYLLNKNDIFLKNYSGLLLLTFLVNQDKYDNPIEIENLIKELSNPNNPLLSLIVEQDGIFKIKSGKKNEGIDILKNLIKKNDIDDLTKSRINSLINAY